jgi:hypothetical protein
MEQAPMTYGRERVIRHRSVANIFRLFGVAIFVSHLAGCASTGLPTVEERTAVGASEKAIVLLRVLCTTEGQQPYEAFGYSLVDDNINFGLGSFKTGGEPERLVPLRFLSPESRKNGWTYFVLPHGIHYLTVHPPRRTDAFTYERGIRNAPRWRIDIPQDARLVYAGTLRFTGESDALLLGGRIVRSIRIDEMSVSNDEDLARKLLTEEFPGLGEAQTLLLSLQQGPTILRSPLPSPTR